jgi:hypothetical protein
VVKGVSQKSGQNSSPNEWAKQFTKGVHQRVSTTKDCLTEYRLQEKETTEERACGEERVSKGVCYRNSVKEFPIEVGERVPQRSGQKSFPKKWAEEFPKGVGERVSQKCGQKSLPKECTI